MTEDYRLVLCTCPDKDTAIDLARTLVQERLAACVSLTPGILSVYRWDSEVQQDEEVLLLIKTRDARVASLTDRLRQIHPYEVPEIIAVPVTDGLPQYLSWVTESTIEPTP